MNIAFRNIEKKDNVVIAALIRGVFEEFGIARPGTVYFDPTTDDLFSLFQKPGSVYWIAEEEGRIVGGCGIYPTENLPQGCSELVKFYLDPAYRGQGIGRQLMDKSIDSAREMGCRMLYLESLPELSRAISLYERAGFRFINHKLGDSGHFGCDIWMIRDL
jgi:putative acetyltransferase